MSIKASIQQIYVFDGLTRDLSSQFEHAVAHVETACDVLQKTAANLAKGTDRLLRDIDEGLYKAKYVAYQNESKYHQLERDLEFAEDCYRRTNDEESEKRYLRDMADAKAGMQQVEDKTKRLEELTRALYERKTVLKLFVDGMPDLERTVADVRATLSRLLSEHNASTTAAADRASKGIAEVRAIDRELSYLADVDPSDGKVVRVTDKRYLLSTASALRQIKAKVAEWNAEFSHASLAFGETVRDEISRASTQAALDGANAIEHETDDLDDIADRLEQAAKRLAAYEAI